MAPAAQRSTSIRSSAGSTTSSVSSTDAGSTVTLQSYRYLGLSTIVEEDNSQDNVNLTYISSSSKGDGGDRYIGLDRFGPGGGCKDGLSGTAGGSGTIKDEYQYTYDADGNVRGETNTQHTARSMRISRMTGFFAA